MACPTPPPPHILAMARPQRRARCVARSRRSGPVWCTRPRPRRDPLPLLRDAPTWLTPLPAGLTMVWPAAMARLRRGARRVLPHPEPFFLPARHLGAVCPTCVPRRGSSSPRHGATVALLPRLGTVALRARRLPAALACPQPLPRICDA
jgi:hypothetical protein